jgi:hypothetical protein
MIYALLPLRDGCLYMRRCGFSPPDKTGYPVPGTDAADGEMPIGQRGSPKPAKAVGHPTIETNNQ